MSEEARELPGPCGLPIVGSLFSLGGNRGRTLYNWTKDYGLIYKVKMGTRTVLAIQGYKNIHQALVEKAECFSGRTEAPVITEMRKGKGLFFAQYGEEYKMWRRFSIQATKEMHRHTKNSICLEGVKFVEYLENLEGQEIELQDVFNFITANVVFQMCYSKRYDLNDEKLKEFVYDRLFTDTNDKRYGLLVFMPYLAHLPSFGNFLNEVKERRCKIVQYLIEMMHDRRNEDKQVPCLTNIYYDSHPEPSDSDLDSFASLIEDMLFVGAITTGSQALWGLLYLILNPEMMNKLQEELDRVLGGCDNPIEEAANKLEEMPYLLAVVEETKRIRPITPSGFFHFTQKATTLGGFRIPKDMPVMANTWSSNHDPKYFPDPEAFKPERFINEEGRFEANEHVLTFGIGWRMCVAEKAADLEMQIFIASCALYFNFELLTKLSAKDMEGRFIGILAPPSFKVKLQRR